MFLVGQPLGTTWMFRDCSELAQLLTGMHAASLPLGSWPHLSPMVPLWRVGPASQTGSTLELSLVAVVWVCQPEGLSVRELALTLVCCEVVAG